MRGRPSGSSNKLKPSVVEDILSERGFNLVHKALDLYDACGDPKVMAQIIKMLMEYQYAKRRPEDSLGQADESNQQAIILTPEAAAELLRLARGAS